MLKEDGEYIYVWGNGANASFLLRACIAEAMQVAPFEEGKCQK